jgi:ABC-type nitrate/sulfonate/bicarbonate transport system substrate-binding protein
MKNMRFRRSMLAQLAWAWCVSAFTLLIGADAIAQSASPLKIRVAAFQNPNLNIWGPLVAKDLGLYAKYGLDADVKLTKSSNILPLLLSGGVDVACTGGPMLDAIIQGQELVIVFGEGAILPYTLVTRAEFTKPEDLKGRTLSTPSVGRGTSYVVLVETLRKSGIQADQVKWVELPDSPTRARALIAGRIDATVLTQDETLLVRDRPEVRTMLETPGNNTEMKPFMYCAATKAYAASHPQELRRWATAMLATHRRLNVDKAAYVELVKKIKGDQYTAKDAEDLFELARRTGYWSLNGGMDPAWHQRSMEYFLSTQTNPKSRPKLPDFYSDEYVRAALNELGKVPSPTDPASWYTPR